MACIRKYFIVASTFRGENLEQRTGIMASVLVSKPIQIINHFLDVTAINVPNAIVKIRNIEVVRCIELGGILTLNNLIIS